MSPVTTMRLLSTKCFTTMLRSASAAPQEAPEPAEPAEGAEGAGEAGGRAGCVRANRRDVAESFHSSISGLRPLEYTASLLYSSSPSSR